MEALVTSVCVSPQYRSRGFGRRLMRYVEQLAAARDIGYLTLWTSTSTAFYSKLGFEFIVMKPRTANVDVTRIEAMLASRRGAEEKTYWMRKRLLDRCGRTSKVLEAPELRRALDGVVLAVEACTWERQLGPSCGLFALRAAALALGADSPNFNLLEEARRRHFSNQGEIFDAAHLADLAPCLGLHACVLEHADWSAVLPLWITQRNLALFAYDRDETNFHSPCLRSGRAAHYALALGYAQRGTYVDLMVLHGLSSQPLVAPLPDFVASNAQIRVAKTDKVDHWHMPLDGNPRLANRLILLEKGPTCREDAS